MSSHKVLFIVRFLPQFLNVYSYVAKLYQKCKCDKDILLIVCRHCRWGCLMSVFTCRWMLCELLALALSALTEGVIWI